MVACVYDWLIKTELIVRQVQRLAMIALTPLVISACGGGGGGASVSPPEITAPTLTRISISEIDNSPGLNLIAAANLYEHGRTGAGVDIAVVDSGVDAGHSELFGRVVGGGDWQGSTSGIEDPNGHGTHVASIAAAARDEQGMQGIAPDASIVSYRILNVQGVFGARSGNTMIPSVMTDVARRGISIVNNSWASFYEINDVSKSDIETLLVDELQSYQLAASETGPIMVWAAGNGSDNNVSARSGLPYYYPNLEENWITVVAVDQQGHEPSYTNRCGVSAAWCITAPGGGDKESQNGVIGAQAGGGYTRKSGTSMAAPLVSGALSLILEAMPSITPRAAAQRLKVTASLQGLTTSSGCTIDTCSEATMRSVFGHGLINVAAALQPIGSASILTQGAERNPVQTSVITAPSVIGSALKDSLKGAIAVVHDDYDGAIMLARMDSAIGITPQPAMNLHSEQQIILATPAGLFFVPSTSAPRDANLAARLIDIPAPATEMWQGWRFDGVQHKTRIMLGQGPDRQAIHMINSDHQNKDWPFWYGVGLDRTNGIMDGKSIGAFDVSTSRSQWGFLGMTHFHGSFQTTGELMIGQTQLNPSRRSLIKGGSFQYDAWSLRTTYQFNPFQISVAVEQPLALRSGHLVLDQPISISADDVTFAARKFNLRTNAKEQHHKLTLVFRPTDELSLNIAAVHVTDYQHQSGNDGQRLELQFFYRF